jgi:hypothetical protein
MNEGDETDKGVKEVWISEVYFGGRYKLVMTVDILVDRKTSSVTKIVDTPKFQLLEIESVQMSSDGRAETRFSGQRNFGSAEWDRVVEANGDFSVIGIQIKKGPPVPDFDRMVQESRARARLNGR